MGTDSTITAADIRALAPPHDETPEQKIDRLLDRTIDLLSDLDQWRQRAKRAELRLTRIDDLIYSLEQRGAAGQPDPTNCQIARELLLVLQDD